MSSLAIAEYPLSVTNIEDPPAPISRWVFACLVTESRQSDENLEQGFVSEQISNISF